MPTAEHHRPLAWQKLYCLEQMTWPRSLHKSRTVDAIMIINDVLWLYRSHQRNHRQSVTVPNFTTSTQQWTTCSIRTVKLTLATSLSLTRTFSGFRSLCITGGCSECRYFMPQTIPWANDNFNSQSTYSQQQKYYLWHNIAVCLML